MAKTTDCGSKPMLLPDDKMPEQWKDDMKMNSLFSPFRSRTVNPLDWDCKVKFWRSLIGSWCVHYKHCAFTTAELKKVFQRKGTTPLCLQTVIDEMSRDRELELESHFVTTPTQQSWASWTVNLLVKKPFVWTLNKVKDSVMSPMAEEEPRYVHVFATKSLAEDILACLDEHHKGQLMDFGELCKVCEKVLQSQKDIMLAVMWLCRQGKAAVCDSTTGDMQLIKFSDKGPCTITELDRGAHALRHNERTLTKHLEQLETEKQKALAEARSYLAKDMRQVAKSCLRKKHELEKSISKRAAALDNVQVLLSRVREAESDGQVLEAYQMGAAALRSSLREAGLTEDGAAGAVAEVQDALDVLDEIQDSLAQPVGPSGDEELEQELADLLGQPSIPPTDQFDRLSLVDTPIPPQTPPSKSPANKPNLLPAS